ncbi:MAG: aconitate hydratase, partial [Sphingomicrobium sp.]
TFLEGMTMQVTPLADITGARVLALLGDSVTTDHISPAGAIKLDSPAGKYLVEKGVPRLEFNSYGARRGNHEVMMRGTFANIRIRNRMLDNVEGGFTKYAPTGETMAIYDAAMLYRQDNRPLVVIAGKEYGTGSSRDWAAKGTVLLGVRAVIAESFERIHRSNLVGMGVLPLQFREGDNAETYGLTGAEKFTITGITELKPRQDVEVKVTRDSGEEFSFTARCRIDTYNELEYFRSGGILQYVLRRLAAG